MLEQAEQSPEAPQQLLPPLQGCAVLWSPALLGACTPAQLCQRVELSTPCPWVKKVRKDCVQSHHRASKSVNPSLPHSITIFLILPDFKTRLNTALTQTINYYHALLSCLPQTFLQHLEMVWRYCNHYLATS